MSINITEISAEETYKLRHTVMWPDKAEEYIVLKDDNDGIHFGLWKDNNIISVISLFINDGNAQFRKFATAISEQGNGYGSLLFEHIITILRGKDINTLWCNARYDKTSFYERFGMRKTDRTFVKSDIKYIIMEMSLVND